MLSTPLVQTTGIGPALTRRLGKLGLETVEDLLHHYPFRYDDFSQTGKISEARVGEVVTFRGELWSIKNTYTRFRRVITKALFNDGSGSIEIIWFNQPWLIKNIKTGDKLQVSGKVDRYNLSAAKISSSAYNSKISLVAPQWEKIAEDTDPVHTGRLVPVYPETYGLSSKWLRNKIAQILPLALPKMTDPLPAFIREKMLPLSQAINQIHFPKNLTEAKEAKKRLAFDELFCIQLATLKKRADWQQKQLTRPSKIEQQKLAEFINRLPFELTGAQSKVLQEIILDLKREYPMNRLVQGEVGSGKTVIAAAVIYLIFLNGLKSVLMAPTEILAFQHYETLSELLKPYDIKIGIYTGSRKRVGEDDVIIGTHALLSEKLDLKDTGLVVVDEQQRFGVEQRSLMRHRANLPHFLTMTATPIPRTVALTLYGDLDLSIIDQMPMGRKIVRTHFVPSQKRSDAYNFIKKEVNKGHQIYIITPLIEESETQASAKAAKAEFGRLAKEVFPEFKLGLLHGKLKSKEKEEAINKFRDHQIDILVSTSVVEVGVDVPNATVMVIEGGERFGLAQLHQLRGRVGRGEEQSYTFLFAQEENYATISRLKNLEKIYDGLKLAELDLKIRGSGEIFGTRQSGRWELKIASLSDLKLIEQTRQKAKMLIAHNPSLDKYPELRAKLDSLASVMPD